jgi:K+-transporting ATPase ATPase A chain
LGTNGGGFFNVNSAHPLENPTPLSNFVEVLSILLIPAALCFTFGAMVGDRRQGRAILAAMALVFVVLLVACFAFEQAGNPLLSALGVDQLASAVQSGGNMEGKEVRFGIANSALWATATTAASNGSVNAMHDSLTPLGGLVPMWLMQLGEVIFGGVGSGLYGMLIFAIVAVFVAGLMIGRTPEYLGKKIRAREIKIASLYFLVTPLIVLGGTAAAFATGNNTTALNVGPHALSEVLYAFTSAGNNNGSAFAGITVNTPWWDTALGLAMLLGRFLPLILVLALAGSLAGQQPAPETDGTLPTHRPLFVGMVAGVTVVLVALTFLPALALGPLAEGLS